MPSSRGGTGRAGKEWPADAPVEITADLETLRRYEQGLSAWRAEVESYCAGRGIACP